MTSWPPSLLPLCWRCPKQAKYVLVKKTEEEGTQVLKILCKDCITRIEAYLLIKTHSTEVTTIEKWIYPVNPDTFNRAELGH